jgi:hypothetical protein
MDLSTLIEIHYRAYRMRPDACSLRLKKWRFADNLSESDIPSFTKDPVKSLETIGVAVQYGRCRGYKPL